LPFIAVFSSSLEADFRSGKNILVSGRHLVREDRNCAIISKELAGLNGLFIGDTVEIGQSRIDEYRVVGIYKNVNSDTGILTHEDIPANLLYISHGDGYPSQYAHDILVKFADGMDSKTVEEFNEYLNEFPWYLQERLSLLPVDEINRTSEGGASVIYDIALTLSVIICITVIFVLGVLIYYHVLSRQKEIGILRTFGERRISAIFLIELCFVTLLSSVAGSVIASVTSKNIMNLTFGLVNEFLNTSNVHNTNSIVIEEALTKQQTMIEYMTAGSYLFCSFVSAAAALATVIVLTLTLIRKAKQISPIEVMGRQ
ncbi:MAG: ABC transporter permease, partial [Eubacteriales bacterium]|nr:ABC transporter permease [Eubacteriales bacterium]